MEHVSSQPQEDPISTFSILSHAIAYMLTSEPGTFQIVDNKIVCTGFSAITPLGSNVHGAKEGNTIESRQPYIYSLDTFGNEIVLELYSLNDHMNEVHQADLHFSTTGKSLTITLQQDNHTQTFEIAHNQSSDNPGLPYLKLLEEVVLSTATAADLNELQAMIKE